MKMDMRKRRGCERAKVPAGCLDWRRVPLSVSSELRGAVQADFARCVNEARIKEETPAARVLRRAACPVNRVAAGVHVHLAGWLHGRGL